MASNFSDFGSGRVLPRVNLSDGIDIGFQFDSLWGSPEAPPKEIVGKLIDEKLSIKLSWDGAPVERVVHEGSDVVELKRIAPNFTVAVSLVFLMPMNEKTKDVLERAFQTCSDARSITFYSHVLGGLVVSADRAESVRRELSADPELAPFVTTP